jgi:hypothetical protein
MRFAKPAPGNAPTTILVDFLVLALRDRPAECDPSVLRGEAARHPCVKRRAVTGFANTAALAAQTNSELILRKPFRTTELVAKIGEVLRRVPAGFG